MVLGLALAVAVPLGAGMAIGLTMKDEVKGWYKTLRKPGWCPPGALFGPVWSVLYCMMGYASWRVYTAGASALTLGLYGAQLGLNLIWTPLFFKCHELGLALADITALIGVLSATIIKFKAVDPTAAYLMLPYLGWTTFAATLNCDIYRRNPGKRGKLRYEKVAKDTKDITLQAAEATQAKAQEVADAAVPKAKEAYGATKAALSDAASVTQAKASEAVAAVKGAVGQGDSTSAKASSAAEDAGASAKGAAGEAKGKAAQVADKAGDKAQEAKGKAGEVADKAGGKAQEAKGAVQGKAEEAKARAT